MRKLYKEQKKEKERIAVLRPYKNGWKYRCRTYIYCDCEEREKAEKMKRNVYNNIKELYHDYKIVKVRHHLAINVNAYGWVLISEFYMRKSAI